MGSLRFALAFTVALCATAPAAALADEPIATIRGDLPPELLDAIERAVGEAKEAPASRLEARRRSRDAARDAELVLRSEGYYLFDIAPEITETDPSRAVVEVKAGVQYKVADPRITWIDPPPSETVRTEAQAAMGLKPGEPGRAAAIVAAEGRIVSTIQKRGYADAMADVDKREVVVEHLDQTVRPNFMIVAGELVRLDGLDLRTKGRTNPAFVQGLAPWKKGDVYDPEDVAELERRLLDILVYESVTVALAPKGSEIDGLRPVVVSLADRPRGTVELGAGYSTSEGIGLDGRWILYNRLGRADTLTSLFRLAEIERRLEAEIALPHWRRPQETARIGGGFYQKLTDAFDEVGANVHADLTRRYGKTSFRTVGLAVDVTRTDERLPVIQTRELVTLTALGALALDRSNDPLDPKTGWRIDARLEPTVSAGDDTLLYLRAQAQGTAYFSFGERARTVAAARLKLGSAVGASLADLPSSRRFYAGGGGSVRGYAYQGVGERLPDNTPVGGQSLFEASGELRQQLTDKWGVVGFVDVGSVGDRETPDFSRVSTGVGLGVRYNLGFGPIRADIALPLNKREGDPDYQIYLSIGQSF